MGAGGGHIRGAVLNEKLLLMMNHIYSVLIMKFSGWLEIVTSLKKKTKLFILMYEVNL